MRRRQVSEALEAERARAGALGERLEEVVTELDGPAFDERILAAMDPHDAALVRAAVASDDAALFADDDPDAGEPAEELRTYRESEVERLTEELRASRARQRALEQYLERLG